MAVDVTIDKDIFLNHFEGADLAFQALSFVIAPSPMRCCTLISHFWECGHTEILGMDCKRELEGSNDS